MCYTLLGYLHCSQAVNAGLRLWKYKWGSYGKQKAISDSE